MKKGRRMVPNHYIITVHNSGSILQRVLDAVATAAAPGSQIIPVLDGCTDESESIVSRFKRTSRHDVTPVYTPDLHEIGAINAGLQVAPPGGVFILQDDIVLMVENLGALVQKHVIEPHENVGYVSFRMGGDVAVSSLAKSLWHFMCTKGRSKGKLIRYIGRYLSNSDSLGGGDGKILKPFDCVTVDIGVKSPVWISGGLRSREPELDRELMPYCYDDVDMCIRSLRRGFANYVFAVPYQSNPSWGGTRKEKSSFSKDASAVTLRNRRYLYQKHNKFLTARRRLFVDGIFGVSSHC